MYHIYIGYDSIQTKANWQSVNIHKASFLLLLTNLCFDATIPTSASHIYDDVVPLFHTQFMYTWKNI